MNLVQVTIWSLFGSIPPPEGAVCMSQARYHNITFHLQILSNVIKAFPGGLKPGVLRCHVLKSSPLQDEVRAFDTFPSFEDAKIIADVCFRTWPYKSTILLLSGTMVLVRGSNFFPCCQTWSYTCYLRSYRKRVNSGITALSSTNCTLVCTIS